MCLPNQRYSCKCSPSTIQQCSVAEGGRLLRKSREDETPQAREGSSTDPRKATTRSETERSNSHDTPIKKRREGHTSLICPPQSTIQQCSAAEGGRLLRIVGKMRPRRHEEAHRPTRGKRPAHSGTERSNSHDTPIKIKERSPPLLFHTKRQP